MVAISVIVPVYNVEKYLPECLDSILNQTFSNLEIILLNDGSTDNSLLICQEYAKKDSRVSVYSHDNIGLGPTRNRGIDLAKGEYLAFVDSDDRIETNGLELLYKKAKLSNADVVQGETIIFTDENNTKMRIRKSLESINDIKLNKESIELFYKQYYFTRIYSHNAWDKIYRREFVKKHRIVYGDNKLIFAEDNWFQLQVMRYEPLISFLNSAFYYYRQQNDSIMHKPKKDLIKRHSRMISDYEKMIWQSKEHELEKKVCAIVAADVLTMEVLNSKIIGRNRKEFLNAIAETKQYDSLVHSISNLFLLNGARLYSCDKNKERYLKVIGWLYSHRLYRVAHNIVWILYKKR